MSTKLTIIEGNSNDKDNVRAYMVKGEPGVSPTVTTTKTGGVATVTIHDGTGDHTFNIADGQDLTDGAVPTGAIIGYDGGTIPGGYEEATGYDSGWINIPLESGITQYSTATQYDCKYRKIGSVVYVIGCVKGISDNNTNLATLPTGYRPINTFRYTTGRNLYGNSILSVSVSGVITFVGLTEGSVITNTDFVYIQTSFLVE